MRDQLEQVKQNLRGLIPALVDMPSDAMILDKLMAGMMPKQVALDFHEQYWNRMELVNR